MGGKPCLVAGRAATVLRRRAPGLCQDGAPARRGQFRDCRPSHMTLCRGHLVAASLVVALAACAELTPGETVAPGTPVVAARQDLSPRFVAFVGPKAQHAPPFLNIPGTNFYCLRSFVDLQTGETAHQLYVADSYFGAERGWKAARDSTGSPLQFVDINRNEISCEAGCSYAEEFAAILPESELRASPGGLAVT